MTSTEAHSAPEIGIVIVSHNTKRFWPRLRAALDAQTYRRWRLVVVDNASRLNERLLAEDLPQNATLIQSEWNLGFAAANNRAVASLQTPLIALLNPDAFPEPAWLEELVAACERWPGAASIGSLQLIADDPDLCDGDGDEFHALGVPYRAGHRLRRPSNPIEGPCFSACAAAALYRSDAYKAAQGFDEDFFAYCEDVDLGYRLRLAGHVCVQAPRAIVHHVSGASASRRSEFATYHGFRNRLWTFIKNTPAGIFWPILPFHLAATMLWATVFLLRGNGLAAFRGLAAGLAGSGGIWKKRTAIQHARKASTLKIASALVWSPITAVRRTNKRR